MFRSVITLSAQSSLAPTPLSIVTMRSTLQLLALGFIAAVAARSPPKELRIGVTNKVECDRPSKAGDKISMHYTGKLWETLEKFDSSLDRNQPFEFRLGQGEVVKGFDVGMTNMCIGELCFP